MRTAIKYFDFEQSFFPEKIFLGNQLKEIDDTDVDSGLQAINQSQVVTH